MKEGLIKKYSIKNKLFLRWLPLLIFIFFIVITLFLSNSIRDELEGDVQEQFFQEMNLVESSILTRADIYINALRSGIGLFEASDDVSRTEWKNFTQSIDLQANFPGIQGFGFSQVVKAEDKDEFIQSMKDQGFSDFTIRPEGNRSEYTAIIYLEPFDVRNQQAFGYDMFSEATRHEAMAAARDSGLPRLSGRVTLVQEIDEDVQAGFLIYLPLYKKGAELEDIENRQNALLGYVYSPFRADDFFNGLFANRNSFVDFAVFDGKLDSMDKNKLIYSSIGKNQLLDKENVINDKFFISRQVKVANHYWTVFFLPQEELTKSLGKFNLSNILLLVGILISILITQIIYAFSYSRNRAIKLADEITQSLKDKNKEIELSKKKLEKANKELKAKTTVLSKKMEEMSQLNKYMLDREETMVNLKQQMSKLKKNKK